MIGAGGVRQGMLSLAPKDKAALHTAYMSFLRGGGLFVANNKRYQIGEEVFLTIILPGDNERLAVAGKVVWITPAGASGGRPAGIGVQFAETPEAETVKSRIETHLAGLIDSDKPTATM